MVAIDAVVLLVSLSQSESESAVLSILITICPFFSESSAFVTKVVLSGNGGGGFIGFCCCCCCFSGHGFGDLLSAVVAKVACSVSQQSKNSGSEDDIVFINWQIGDLNKYHHSYRCKKSKHWGCCG